MQSNKQSGTVTLELLIAFAILILNLTAVILILNSSQFMFIDTTTNQEAIIKAESMLEQAYADSKHDFNLINTTSPTVEEIYQKRLIVETLDFFTKKVTSLITWQNEKRSQKVELVTLITNPAAVNGGDTCNSTPSGDWSNPQLLGSINMGQGTGATDVDVFAGRAYLTTDSGTMSDHDFYILDVSDPSLSPLPILSSINTGYGLHELHVTKDYAYVANDSINGQLQIIDIQDPHNPLLINTFKLPNVTGANSVGNSIFYFNKMIYLGLTSTTTGPEFNIINVSDSTNPALEGGYDIGHQVNSIFVKDGFAYIASPNNNELIILDISDPSTPTLIANINLSDNSANGKSIDVVGDTLFLGRTVGASPSTRELQLINILDKTNPIILNSMDINSTINALKIRGNLAFMTINKTASSTVGFQVWDLNTKTLYGSNPIEQTSPGGMDCEGNLLYVAQKHNKALQIIGPGP